MEGTLNALEDQQRQLVRHVHALEQQLVRHRAACLIQRWWRDCLIASHLNWIALPEARLWWSARGFDIDH